MNHSVPLWSQRHHLSAHTFQLTLRYVFRWFKFTLILFSLLLWYICWRNPTIVYFHTLWPQVLVPVCECRIVLFLHQPVQIFCLQKLFLCRFNREIPVGHRLMFLISHKKTIIGITCIWRLSGNFIVFALPLQWLKMSIKTLTLGIFLGFWFFELIKFFEVEIWGDHHVAEKLR